MSGIARNTETQLVRTGTTAADCDHVNLEDAADAMVLIPSGWPGGTLSIFASHTWPDRPYVDPRSRQDEKRVRGSAPWTEQQDWQRDADFQPLHDTTGTPVQIASPAEGWHRLPQACFPAASIKLVAQNTPADQTNARNWLAVQTKS